MAWLCFMGLIMCCLKISFNFNKVIIQNKTIQRREAIKKSGYGILEGCKEFWTFSLYDVKDNVLLCAKLEKGKSLRV